MRRGARGRVFGAELLARAGVSELLAPGVLPLVAAGGGALVHLARPPELKRRDAHEGVWGPWADMLQAPRAHSPGKCSLRHAKGSAFQR